MLSSKDMILELKGRTMEFYEQSVFGKKKNIIFAKIRQIPKDDM